MKAIIKGTIVGGIIAYVWLMVSWMVLPWHMMTFEEFKSDTSVQTTLLRNAPKSGVYVLPSIKEMQKESEEQMDKGKSKMHSEIFVFASIEKDMSKYKSPMMFVTSFITQLIGAFFITWLVKASEVRSYLGRVVFIVGIALTAGILVFIPMNTWWFFPPMYIGVNMLDLIIQWFLAGLAIASFTRKPTQVVGLQ